MNIVSHKAGVPTAVDYYNILLSRIKDEEGVFYNTVIEFCTNEDDNNIALTTLISEIYEDDPKTAVSLAIKAAEIFTKLCINELFMYDEEGNDISSELDFTIKDIQENKFDDVLPLSPVFPEFFFITIHKSVNSGFTDYNPSISIVGNGLNKEKYAVSIVTSIHEDNIDSAIKNAILSGVRLANNFKEDIMICDEAGIESKYHRTVHDFLEDLEIKTQEKQKYLH